MYYIPCTKEWYKGCLLPRDKLHISETLERMPLSFQGQSKSVCRPVSKVTTSNIVEITESLDARRR